MNASAISFTSHGRGRFFFFMFLIFLLTILYRLMLPAVVIAEPFEKVLDRLRNNIVPLDLGSQPQPSPEAVSYFQYYGKRGHSCRNCITRMIKLFCARSARTSRFIATCFSN